MLRDLSTQEMETIERLTIAQNVRIEVLRFAQAMEEVLHHNDYKGGWSGCSDHRLRERMNQEVKEANKAPDDITEIIDVANFCMMIWDNQQVAKV